MTYQCHGCAPYAALPPSRRLKRTKFHGTNVHAPWKRRSTHAAAPSATAPTGALPPKTNESIRRRRRARERTPSTREGARERGGGANHARRGGEDEGEEAVFALGVAAMNVEEADADADADACSVRGRVGGVATASKTGPRW